MDGGGAKKGSVNFQRRTWDKSEYEDRAKERAEKEALGEDELDVLPDGRKAPAPYRAAPEGLKRVAGSERAYVQARTDELHLDAKLHKKQSVTDATPINQTGGYWCELCQCNLRDSSTYLSHINGIKHQRRLGQSMRVERVGISDVKSKLAALSALKAGGGGGGGRGGPSSAQSFSSSSSSQASAFSASRGGGGGGPSGGASSAYTMDAEDRAAMAEAIRRENELTKKKSSKKPTATTVESNNSSSSSSLTSSSSASASAAASLQASDTATTSGAIRRRGDDEEGENAEKEEEEEEEEVDYSNAASLKTANISSATSNESTILHAGNRSGVTAAENSALRQTGTSTDETQHGGELAAVARGRDNTADISASSKQTVEPPAAKRSRVSGDDASSSFPGHPLDNHSSAAPAREEPSKENGDKESTRSAHPPSDEIGGGGENEEDIAQLMGFSSFSSGKKK